jgi:type III pantothenate kinase
MLLIDAGNTRIKSGFWDRGSISSLTAIATTADAPPADWQSLSAPSRVVISNVAGAAIATKLAAWIDTAWSLEPDFVIVRQNTAGVVTRYDDVEQLGVDRWLAVLAGYRLSVGAVGVIDAGTALTVDIVDGNGVHLGGSISPGLSLMVDSLTRKTARLRLDPIERTDSVATNTAAAISAGCIDAVAGAIERIRYKAQALLAMEPKWIITGGEAPKVMEVCAVEFEHVPDLVLRGLVLAAGDDS